jgi:hypothetical protein
MKKGLMIVVLGVCVLALTVPAMAFDAGQYRLSGSSTVAFSSVSIDESGAPDLDQTIVQIIGGYFVTPSIEVGAILDYVNISDDSFEESGTRLVPFVNYYFSLSDNYFRLGAGFETGTDLEFWGPGEPDVSGYLINAEYVMMLNEVLSVDFGLKYRDVTWDYSGGEADLSFTNFGAGFSLYF